MALEALGERRGALVSDAVASEPVNERWSGDGERSGVSRGADAKANAFRRQAHLSEVSAAAEGSNLLSTIAPGTPTPLRYRSSSVMLFSRKERSGIPQKSVIPACSSTTLASWSAASPVMSFHPTLCVTGAGDVSEVHDGLVGVCFLVNGR